MYRRPRMPRNKGIGMPRAKKQRKLAVSDTASSETIDEDFAEAEKDAGESDAQVTEPVLAPAAAPMPAATRTDRRAAADILIADKSRVFLHAQK